jgi:hypothetical protein
MLELGYLVAQTALELCIYQPDLRSLGHNDTRPDRCIKAAQRSDDAQHYCGTATLPHTTMISIRVTGYEVTHPLARLALLGHIVHPLLGRMLCINHRKLRLSEARFLGIITLFLGELSSYHRLPTTLVSATMDADSATVRRAPPRNRPNHPD